jgi:hypothetical protein
MKLSEAISLGSMLTPQAIGTFQDARGGRCALASAIDAIGQSPAAFRSYEEWIWTKRMTNCPACGRMASIPVVIAHLNDQHTWNRDRIAQWVATIEPTEETSSEGEEFASAV